VKIVSEKKYNVLFLCTGNSARSIIAECLLDRLGHDKFHGFSAGSHPAGKVNPGAIAELERNGFDTITLGLRSKDWEEFASPDAPQMDFVFTVCDKAASETCPVWPGQPMTAHWGIKDPAAVEGGEETVRHAFARAYRELRNRISIFVELPIESLDALALQKELDSIGKSED
jgi:arsenate reductase